MCQTVSNTRQVAVRGMNTLHYAEQHKAGGTSWNEHTALRRATHISDYTKRTQLLGPVERLMTGELRQLHNEERHSFSTSPISSPTTLV